MVFIDEVLYAVTPDPLFKILPLEAWLNQSTVSPVLTDAAILTDPGPQIALLMAVGGLGISLITAKTGVLVNDTHPAAEVLLTSA